MVRSCMPLAVFPSVSPSACLTRSVPRFFPAFPPPPFPFSRRSGASLSGRRQVQPDPLRRLERQGVHGGLHPGKRHPCRRRYRRVVTSLVVYFTVFNAGTYPAILRSGPLASVGSAVPGLVVWDTPGALSLPLSLLRQRWSHHSRSPDLPWWWR